MHSFALLIQEYFIKVGCGEMTSFAEHFPQTPFLHASRSHPAREQNPGLGFKAEGGNCSQKPNTSGRSEWLKSSFVSRRETSTTA
jgi:hypothetical protein